MNFTANGCTVSSHNTLKKRLHILRKNCRWRSSNPGDVFNQWLLSELSIRSSKNTFDIIYFLLPFTVLSCKRWVQLAFLCFGGYQIYYGAVTSVRFHQYGTFTHETYRLRVSDIIMPKGLDSPNHSLIVESVALRRGGCDVYDSIATSAFHTSRTSISFETYWSYAPPTEMDGFRLTFGGPPSKLIFILEGYHNSTGQWTTVGSSRIRRTLEGIRFLGGMLNTSQSALFDLQPTWPLIFSASWVRILIGLICVASSVIGGLGYLEQGRSVMSVGLVVLGFNMIAAAIGYFWIGEPRETFMPLAYTLDCWLIVALIRFSQRLLPYVLLFHGACILAARALNDCLLFEDCDYFFASFEYEAAICLASGVIFLMIIRSSLRSAITDTQEDRARFDDQWASICRRSKSQVEKLGQLTDSVAAACAAESARQLGRSRSKLHPAGDSDAAQPSADALDLGRKLSATFSSVSPVFWIGPQQLDGATEAHQRTVPGTRDPKQPVRCLTQLYSQAMIAAPSLRDRAAGWAAQSSGELLLDTVESAAQAPPSLQALLRPNLWMSGIFRRRSSAPMSAVHSLCGDHDVNDEVEEWVRAGLIKRPARAVEKALLCYGGDVSRLLDLCRLRLTFDSVAGITLCVRAIAGDRNVTIVRIRNSLAADYDTRLSAGFRGVVVNLTMSDQKARFFGVENHVCEVQLLLKSLSSLQDAAQHQRFLQFRSVRPYCGELLLSFAPRSIRSIKTNLSFMVFDTSKSNEFSHDQTIQMDANHGGPGGTLIPTLSEQPLSNPVAFLCDLDASPSTEGAGMPFVAQHVQVELDVGDRQMLPTAEDSGCGVFLKDASILDESQKSEVASLEMLEHLGSQENIANHLLETNDILRTRRVHGCDKDDNVVHYETTDFMLDTGLYEAYVRSSLQGARSLDGRSFYDSLLSSSSVFFTSKPVTVAASKSVFQIGAFIISIYFLYRSYSNIIVAASNGFLWTRPSAVRLTALGLRNVSLPAWKANAITFGLPRLHDGCNIKGLTGTSFGSNKSDGNPTGILGRDEVWPMVVLNLTSDVELNGYFLEVSNGSIEADPVQWTVEAFMDNESWTMIGASGWSGPGGSATYYPSMAYPTPTQRGVKMSFDFRASWDWIMVYIAAYITAALGWTGYLLSGLTRKTKYAVPVLSGMFILNSFLEGVAAVAAQTGAGENWREAVIAWMYAIPDFIFGVCLVQFERHTVLALKAYGVCKIIGVLVNDLLLYPNGSSTLFNILASAGFVSVLFTSGNLIFYRRALSRARRLVLDDKRRYDAAWAEVMQKNDSLTQISMLLRRTETLVQEDAGPPRHLSREFEMSTYIAENGSLVKPDSEVHVRHFDCGVPGTRDVFRTVNSLDQLYIQAVCLNPILLGKVQLWADMSQGCFQLEEIALAVACDLGMPTKMNERNVFFGGEKCDIENRTNAAYPECPHGYVRWSEVKGNRIQSQYIKWAKVKAVERAIEKVSRSYSNDVSRLLDICRQSIVFETVEDVLACINAIAGDPDVVILRVKNRLDPDFDSALSAGYRNLALNLRIETDETKRLGLENHVCEVQLILRCMAAIKNDDGHKKYIAFRNLRGE